MRTIFFILYGYLSGSVLYAWVFAHMLKKEDIIGRSKDGNPGTANAFLYGGAVCGILTLTGDLLKGFLPVWLYMRCGRDASTTALSMALVLTAPVIGHAFSVFHRFEGGKGIAVSFGCLLGLMPVWQPVLLLAAFFLLFSLILRITPHFYRTGAAYLCASAAAGILKLWAGIQLGFWMITSVVLLRLHLSRELKDKMKVRLLWRH